MRNLILPTLVSGLIAASLPACAAFVPGKIGAENRYQISYEGDGTSSVRGLLTQQATQADRIQTGLHAQLETVQVTPSVLSVRLIDIAHTLVFNGEKQDRSREMTLLEKPCFLAVDAKGRVLSVSFASDVPTGARRMMRTLVSDLEFVQSEGARTWQVEQDTVNGAAQATYRFVNSATAEKRILLYADTRKIGPKGAPQMRPTTQGALRFTFRQGHLQSVNGAFSTQFRLGSRSFSSSQDRLQLTRLSGRAEAKVEIGGLQANCRAQFAQEPLTALHAFDTNTASQSASWTPLLKGATVPSLLADLGADDAKGVGNDSAAFSSLCALMTLHPETCVEFEKALATAQPNKISTRLILSALASVAGAAQERTQAASPSNTAAEQALYGALASHRTQADMVVVMASSLGMIGAPGPEMERLLESLAASGDSDIAGSCTLALGGVVQHGSPAVAKAALAALKRKLAKSDDFGKQTVLAALGNAGSAATLDTLAFYAHHPVASLRAVAMMSLRLVPGPRASALLYQGLHDADADVRLNAARAFQFRPFTPADVHAFTGLVTVEKAERVRLALLENLKLEAAYYPQVRAVMQRAAAHDASADVRQTVTGWLQS